MKTPQQIKNEVEKGYFRSYNFEDNNNVKLCEHIEIKGKLMNSDDGCEYIETLEITCNKCNTTFILQECIN
jgi:hypothetical protein